MRRTAAVAFAFLGLTAACRGATPEDSVVRVFATLRLPNPVRPWAKQNPVEVFGTGVVLDGKHVLTNAHIVLYASEVFVQGRQGGDRVPAKVASIGPEIDLATLTPDDPSFLEKRPPIPRAPGRPATNAAVSVLGFPVNGSGLAVTRGVVSRIDYAPYNASADGLRLQIDANVEFGNSGGPALVDGKMVGLVFRKAQNVGFVIPNEEIDAYLDDVKDGKYDGKLRVTDHFQPMVNEGLRKKLGLARGDRGIMVTKPGQDGPAYPLREGDVLTHFGGVAVDNEGLVDFDGDLRLPFTSLLSKAPKGGAVPVRLIRDGKPVEAALPTTREDDRVIRSYRGQHPPYFVHGPLVFSPALEQALPYYAQGNPLAVAGGPLESRGGDRRKFPGEELVVVTAPLLAHPIARGYAEPFGQVVKDVDGAPVRNLKHLVELLRDARGEFLTLRFHGDYCETLVFVRKAIDDATPDLMSENGIAKRGSDDLMAVWGGKGGGAADAKAP